MIEQLLKDIGLSANEARLYLTLLRYGQKPITFLSQKAGLNRGLGYVLLHALLDKGLVTKVTKGRVQYFSALDPEHLIHFLEHKKGRIERQQEQVHAALGQLAALANPLASTPKIRFFTGADGARTLLELVGSAKQKTICAYLAVEDAVSLLGAAYFKTFLDQLSTDGYNLHAIRTRADDQDASADDLTFVGKPSIRGAKGAERRILFAPRSFAFPMSVFLCDDKIALLSSRRENFALLIESREYAELQMKLFELLWNSLEKTTIRIGVLHSLSGTMAISERPLVDAILMAVDEINGQGGILGKRIDPIVLDGASNPDTFMRQAEVLITKYDVAAVFGGWTSACRKTMKPVFEKHRHLLWYAVQYEGLEHSEHIIYSGAAPNQQVLPAVDWAVKHLGRKFFLVGSDYVFPKSANEIIKGRLAELGATVVGEAYERLGGRGFAAIVKQIKQARPDAILNTINGDSNLSFFAALRTAGISSAKIPTISFSIGEEEISRMHPEALAGDYAAWCYFQSLRSEHNDAFVEGFQTKYGRHRMTDDPIEASYFNVHLFAQAVKKAGTDEIGAVRAAARGLSLPAPEGAVRIDPDNQHVHRWARIGQIREDGQFKIVWSSASALKPDPYPKYKSLEEWEQFLEALQSGWAGHWAGA